MLITAVLSNPGIFSTNVTVLQINSQNGSWANTVKLTVTDSTSAAVTFPAQLVSAPPGALTLDGHQTGVLKWVVNSADSNTIAAGTYRVFISIDTTASAGTTGWNGTVTSDVALVQVNATNTPTQAQTEQKLISEAVAEHLLGNDTQAITALDQLLSQNPQSIRALELKGAVLTSMGQLQAALDATQQALDNVYAQDPNPQEPPTLLVRLASSLRDQIFISTSAPPVATTTTATSANATFSPADQSISLSAAISSTGGTVTGGTIMFTVVGVGNSVTSAPLTQGNASALFTVPAGTHAGTYALQASYGGTSAFLPSSDSTRLLTVQKATPKITWNSPPSAPAGTALGAAQLNATADVPGTFAYTPPAGTIMSGGTSQTLNVIFTPTDTGDYNTASASVSLNILAGSYSGSVSPSTASIKVGSSQTFSVTVNSTNFVGPVSLSCANPPAGIACNFSTGQVDLKANGSSTSMLTISVSAKPKSGLLSPLDGPWNTPLFQKFRATWQWAPLMLFVLLLAMIGFRRASVFARPSRQFSLAAGLFILLSITLSLNSCTSAEVVGQGSGGGGGSGSPAATVQVVVQGASGTTTVGLGTVSITVP
jgi:Bacterial Ig-like domain (group 3)